MARANREDLPLDSPKGLRTSFVPRFTGTGNRDRMGRFSESFARAMGTPWFLVGMTMFCLLWLGYNTWAPEKAQFDPRALNYTLLTLILSLQASYAAPMILLAQNRQDDRDRVSLDEDRNRASQTKADTEYLARELAALRIAIGEIATRDYLRGELDRLRADLDEGTGVGTGKPKRDKPSAKSKAPAKAASAEKAVLAASSDGDLAGF
jgi:uncharacterized membrane protein